MSARLSVALAMAVVLLLGGCLPYRQLGSADLAAAAAVDFLDLLERGDATGAWRRLTPATRQVRYADDFDAFAADVVGAAWPRAGWVSGPVVDHDISWGVYLDAGGEPPPAFLLVREIAGSGLDGRGLHLLVQFVTDVEYVIGGRGLDTRL